MDNKYLNLKLECNGNVINIGKDYNYRLLEISGLESSEYEVAISNSTSGDGGIVGNKRIKPRPISFIAEFTDVNMSEFERQTLIRFFNPKSTGILTVNYSGVTRCINYEIESFKESRSNLYESLKVLVNLICPEPYFKDIESTKVNIANWTGDFKFPLTIMPKGIIMGKKNISTIANIFNVGDVSCGIKIEFRARGTVKNPSLFNVNTREYIRLNKVMVAGEKITINTSFGNKKIESYLSGSITNILNYYVLTSTFLQLEPGDNVLKYDADENLTNLEISIYFTAKYLGV